MEDIKLVKLDFDNKSHEYSNFFKKIVWLHEGYPYLIAYYLQKGNCVLFPNDHLMEIVVATRIAAILQWIFS